MGSVLFVLLLNIPVTCCWRHVTTQAISTLGILNTTLSCTQNHLETFRNLEHLEQFRNHFTVKSSVGTSQTGNQPILFLPLHREAGKGLVSLYAQLKMMKERKQQWWSLKVTFKCTNSKFCIVPALFRDLGVTCRTCTMLLSMLQGLVIRLVDTAENMLHKSKPTKFPFSGEKKYELVVEENSVWTEDMTPNKPTQNLRLQHRVGLHSWSTAPPRGKLPSSPLYTRTLESDQTTSV